MSEPPDYDELVEAVRDTWWNGDQGWCEHCNGCGNLPCQVVHAPYCVVPRLPPERIEPVDD